VWSAGWDGPAGLHPKAKDDGVQGRPGAEDPQGQGAKVKLAISGHVRPLDQSELQRELDGFEQGVPECKTCPLGLGGEPVSCYRYITYPIDQAFEELVFSYYYSTITVSGSPAQTITDESIAAELRRDSSPFHERGAGGLAEREEPLVARFNEGKLVIDSAHLRGRWGSGHGLVQDEGASRCDLRLVPRGARRVEFVKSKGIG